MPEEAAHLRSYADPANTLALPPGDAVLAARRQISTSLVSRSCMPWKQAPPPASTMPLSNPGWCSRGHFATESHIAV